MIEDSHITATALASSTIIVKKQGWNRRPVIAFLTASYKDFATCGACPAVRYASLGPMFIISLQPCLRYRMGCAAEERSEGFPQRLLDEWKFK